MDELLAGLRTIYPLSQGLEDHLLATIKKRKYRKSQFLIKAGRENNNVFYVSKGWARSYYYNSNQKEVSLRFVGPGDFVASDSNWSRKKRFEYIQALEPMEVYYLSNSELQFIYERFLEYNYIARVLLQQHVSFVNDEKIFLRLPNAELKYKFLMANYPQMIQKFPVKYLASYLGISENHLSNIRKKSLRFS